MRKTLTTLSLALALVATQALAAPAAPSDMTTAGGFLLAANEKEAPKTKQGTPATPATPNASRS